MKLYFVRHAQPLVEQGVCYGASDVLCSSGAMESAALGLLEALPRGLPIISSPLSRCERLAQTLCRLEPTFVYKTDEKLSEMNFGAWEMQAWDAIVPEELTAWTNAFASYRCGGTGQSTGIFVQRVAQLLFESAQNKEDQIWITHAGVIRAVQWISEQPYELFTALVSQPDLEQILSHLRAADWPKSELAYCQVLRWDWPKHWGAL